MYLNAVEIRPVDGASVKLDRRRIKSLYFGKASAEAEVAADPDRFLRTFYDRWEVERSVWKQDYFLVVGPKGAGKSAIGEYIRLSLEASAGSHAVFAKTLNLDEVSPNLSPITSITSKLASDETAGTTAAAWRLFLTLRMFELVVKDQSCSLARDPAVLQLAARLRSAGLTPGDFPTLLRRVRENKTSVSIKGFVGRDWIDKDTSEIAASHVGEALTELLVQMTSDNHFLLVIDGLDRIISDNSAYWRTLAALIVVADDLHKKFQQAAADLRILVMCRSDVFRMIHFADSDKIAGDSVLYIDWGAQQTKRSDSPLWDYIARKAEITTDELFSLLPDKVTVGQRAGNPRSIRIADYLLDFTRSTPREMALLMQQIQLATPTNGYVTEDRVREAADAFASRDLLTIVNAEATGIVKSEFREGKLAEVISGLPAAVGITLQDFSRVIRMVGLNDELAGSLTEFLFMAGLIGNYDNDTGYVQFYHRRDTYKFRRQGPWILHVGLMYAFNIKRTRV
jgi:hypothetical protein